ncbi:MAG: dipeptide epimerase [Cytophagaceae bacterium]|nr:dipeptide epimerase [Cytophagaceae bacterium]MDW8455870.1 enolase C-terminal domain-like protein [Cytophagaceae bacterium]
MKYNWKISRNNSSEKRNYIVKYDDGINFGLAEAAPNIRYGETPELIEQQFNIFKKYYSEYKHHGLNSILKELPLANALKFAIEAAYVHAQAKASKKKIHEYLGLRPPAEPNTSYSVPIMQPDNIAAFIKQHQLNRFAFLKIKIDAENANDILNEVSRRYRGYVRIDANEAWNDPDQVLKFMYAHKHKKIQFFEQPMPSEKIDEYIYLKKNSIFEIIADESITADSNIELLAKQFHGVNIKLMKCGGYYSAIKQIQTSINHGIKVMLGCMIETTLGIFSAYNLSYGINYIDLDGFFIIENEPFNIIFEKQGKLYCNDSNFYI